MNCCRKPSEKATIGTKGDKRDIN